MGAFLVPLALYLLSGYRDVTYWDVGEMDTVPWIFGIAHPPGFPLYVILAWAFTHLLPIGSVAFRMTLLSAVATSIASWCIARMVCDATKDRIAGVSAALLFAFGLVVWTRATRAEVHAVETAFFAATLMYALRWYGSLRRRDLLIAASLYGCAIAVHPVALMALPGLLVLFIARIHESDPKTLLQSVGITLVFAIVWFLYIPLRSAFVSAHGLDPAAALGMPGSAFWDYHHPANAEGFLALIGARDIDVHGAVTGAFNGDAMPAAIAAAVVTLAKEFGFAGIAFVAAGAIGLFRRDRVQAGALMAIVCIGALFAASFNDESDRARYFMQSFVIAAYFCGLGLAALRSFGRWPRIAGAVSTAAIAGVLLWQGHVLFGQPHDGRARAEIGEVLAKTPDNAIVVSTWVLAPPLAYAAYVERATGQRTIVPAWYGDTADVLNRWTKTRPVFVSGTPEGSVAGFRLERLPAHTELYRVVHE